MLGYLKLKKMSDVDKLSRKFDWNDVMDLVMFMVPIGIICARLYYCAFKWDYYSANPWEILKIWNGGIAIYGAVIGGIITGYIYCKIKKIQFLDMADFCIPYLALCQSIGRWGNFVNAEAHGTITDSFLKMGIYNAETHTTAYYHPTFLYESICTFIIFIILSIVDKKKKFVGQAFYLYFILYGIARFFIEGLRTDSLYIANTDIRVSQLLSLILVFIFAILYVLKRTGFRATIIKAMRK